MPNVKERLFEAAERVLEREGPAGLTNRAVTEEAGCAKGLLYSHFTDLDDFVAQLVLTRFHRVAEELAPLPARAGTGEVAANLTRAAQTLLGTNGPALTVAALSRPAVATRIRAHWSDDNPAEGLIADYLAAEQRLGRLPATTDCPVLALAVVATTHHLLMTATTPTATQHALLARLVAALL
ncbi:TetR/AcrR family transcriptional regulator [Streptomyces sp. NRRL WC-3742]|uniref:TetR/AcrR family transcriptional regulator n=1 Tax=Streptomyces sp. NRRL WC-3742 TaxID=1463934 RepID=UPI000A959635|nr:TetR/AcrR family transcriptional regulator [Streptomyces sp. NRRL WC-3742]